jgi:hypothetical protein
MFQKLCKVVLCALTFSGLILLNGCGSGGGSGNHNSDSSATSGSTSGDSSSSGSTSDSSSSGGTSDGTSTSDSPSSTYRFCNKPIDEQDTGDYDDPIMICSAQDLEEMYKQDSVAYGSMEYENYQLANDLTLENFTPLGGNGKLCFQGTFDGNGHTINLTINSNNIEDVGLFGCLTSIAEIKNLKIIGNITAKNSKGNLYVGSISGIAYQNADGVYEKGSVSASDFQGNLSCEVSSSASTCSIGSFGGMGLDASGVRANATISCSGAGGTTCNAGGLIGEDGNVTASYAMGTVSANASNNRTGGIIGFQNSESFGAIRQCVAMQSNIIGLVNNDDLSINLVSGYLASEPYAQMQIEQTFTYGNYWLDSMVRPDGTKNIADDPNTYYREDIDFQHFLGTSVSQNDLNKSTWWEQTFCIHGDLTLGICAWGDSATSPMDYNYWKWDDKTLLPVLWFE